jgi:hypothetical protein
MRRRFDSGILARLCLLFQLSIPKIAKAIVFTEIRRIENVESCIMLFAGQFFVLTVTFIVLCIFFAFGFRCMLFRFL